MVVKRFIVYKQNVEEHSFQLPMNPSRQNSLEKFLFDFFIFASGNLNFSKDKNFDEVRELISDWLSIYAKR